MKLRTVLAIFVLAFSGSVFAASEELTLLCTKTNYSDCSSRVIVSLESLGCEPRAETIICRDAVTDPLLDPSEIENVRGKDFCTIRSSCTEPSYGNFGGVSCEGGAVDLKRADRGLTLTTSVGIFRRPVTILCK